MTPASWSTSYGPHIFHTNSKEVFDYLSRFTEWRQYQHKVLASVDGQLVPIPINLDTINRLYGLKLSSFEMEEFLASRAEPSEQVRTSEDVVVSKVGRELYEKFFPRLHAQAVGAGSIRTGCPGYRAGADPHQPR